MNTASKSANGATQEWKNKTQDEETSSHAKGGSEKVVVNAVQATGKSSAKNETALAKAEDWAGDMAKKVEELDVSVRNYIGERAIPMAICAVGVGVIAALVQNHLAANSKKSATRSTKEEQ